MKQVLGKGLLVLLLLPCACKVGPDYRPPPAPLAHSYTQISPEKGVHQQIGADLIDWWSRWNDPILHELACQAVAGNPSLREAALRIQRARAQVGVTRSELFPQLTADGSYRLSKTAGISQSLEKWDLGTGMSWELDVFGRLRHYADAAVADMEVERELYRDTYLILLSDIATNYVTARAYQRQIDIAQQNIVIRRDTLRMTEGKVETGTSHQLDVNQARGSLESVEAELPELRAGLRWTLNRLSVLLGCPPGSYVDELLARPAPIPRAPDEICIGIPADLLRRRPDIRAAEKRIIAQTERIGGAVGDLYPMFSLSGDFGLEASTFSGLWNAQSIAAGISPGFRWNILHFGRYRSNVRAQEFRQQELVAAYQETVLLAAEEVDNALASYVHEKERREKLSRAVQSYGMALRLSEERYDKGMADFQRVLDSQREKLSFEMQLTVSELNVIKNVIDLYRALGGGWQYPLMPIPGNMVDPEPAAGPTPAPMPPIPVLPPQPLVTPP